MPARKLSRLALACCCVGLLLAAKQAAADEPVLLAVNAPSGLADVQRWQAMGQYFSEQLGQPVKVVGFLPMRIDKAVETAQVEFAIVNPVAATVGAKLGTMRLLASLKQGGIAHYAGTIVTRRGSGYTTAAALKGSRIWAYRNNNSAGGYVFQAYYLLNAGIDMRQDLAELRWSDKLDDIVIAVLRGYADAGFVRSGWLEDMAEAGKVKLDDFVVIDAKQDELKPLHSTPLYPQWYLVASSKATPALAAKLRAAALALPAGHPASSAAKVDGFIEPISYVTIVEALTALRIAPFDK